MDHQGCGADGPGGGAVPKTFIELPPGDTGESDDPITKWLLGRSGSPVCVRAAAATAIGATSRPSDGPALGSLRRTPSW
eukprot:19325-Pyramimonas_sp.AAC.1